MSLLWRLARSEGLPAMRHRLLDRLEGWQRRRSFRTLGTAEALPEVSVLNVLPTPPRPDWGGVQVQLLRRLDAEAAHRPWALLFPDGAVGFRLEVRDGDTRRALRVAEPRVAAAVREAVDRLGAGIVHVEQSVGLPLDELAELAGSELGETDLALVLSVHDFGLFCRRPHLIERPQLAFCGFCRDDERCRRCLSHDAPATTGDQIRWRATAQRLLDAASMVIYPSESLRRTYQELFRLDPARQHVVAPPVVARPVEVPRLRTGPIRHLAYVGSVQPHKGAHVLVELIERLRRQGRDDLRWSVYGGGDPDLLRSLRATPSVRVHGYYRAGSLPHLLRRDGVDLALLLSIWPETYALTLDECRLAGVPVLAFDHGAPADRIRDWGAGVLVDPAAGAEGLAAVLEGYESPPPPEGAVRVADAESAAACCLEIYRSVSGRGQST